MSSRKSFFVNKAQQIACRAQAANDIANGIRPLWNCHLFSKGKHQNSSERIPLSKNELKVHEGVRGGKFRLYEGQKFYAKEFQFPKSSRKSSSRKSSSNEDETIHTGPRGGKYMIQNGRKVYIASK